MTTNYDMLKKQLHALLEGESHRIAIFSNTSALLNDYLSDINWVGFYLYENDALILGPFQGHPACVHIPVGKGVCGTAVSEKKTQRVEDVNAFPGHIACDANSKSEIVIPIYKNKHIVAVLDIDAPIYSRFTEEDQRHLEEIGKMIESFIA